MKLVLSEKDFMTYLADTAPDATAPDAAATPATTGSTKSPSTLWTIITALVCAAVLYVFCCKKRNDQTLDEAESKDP